jgi:nucleosome binding factor SPN SPT16 subunit
MDVIISLK